MMSEGHGFKIVALAADDGWAVVKQGERHVLVRPSYRVETFLELTEDAVNNLERCVFQHGFAAADIDFDDWLSLFAFLQTKRLSAFLGIKTGNTKAIETLMRRAPPQVVERYVSSMESDLLPRAEHEAIGRLCRLLAEGDAARSSPELRARLDALLSALPPEPQEIAS